MKRSKSRRVWGQVAREPHLGSGIPTAVGAWGRSASERHPVSCRGHPPRATFPSVYADTGDTQRHAPQAPPAGARSVWHGAGKWAPSGRERLARPSEDGPRTRVPGAELGVPALSSVLQQFPAARRMNSERRSVCHSRARPRPKSQPPVSLPGMSLPSAAGEPRRPGPRPCDRPGPEPATQRPSPGNRSRWPSLPRRWPERRRPRAVAHGQLPWPPPAGGCLSRPPSALGPAFVKFPFSLSHHGLFLGLVMRFAGHFACSSRF